MTDAKDERRPAGELEATVMAALWAAGVPRTPGQVQTDLAVDLARTTVTTILTRLHDKGVVGRERQGRGYAYFPVEDAPGLTARRMHSELDRDTDRETVLARFVARLSTEDERILRELLESEPESGERQGPESGEPLAPEPGGLRAPESGGR